MTKPKPTPRWFAIIAWFGCGISAIVFPVSGAAFETGEVYLVSSPSLEHQAQSSNVLVFDNNLLDRLFGKHRASEKARNETVPADDRRAANVFGGAASSPISPNGSLLAGITRNVAPRRAAALHLAEKGRVLLQSGEYRRALYPLEKALGLDANPVIYFYLARAHYYLGNDDQASGFLAAAEAGSIPDASWTGELLALRTAISARPVVQRTATKQNMSRASEY
jgi:tetratricopeptide (TPR) repeat protein